MIYLASQSPRRKEILKKMGFRFRVAGSSYHEKHKKRAPSKLVLEHAVGKALGASVKVSKGLVVGADTLVYARGKVLGKPKTQAQAVAMLKLISGRAHSVYTGVAVRDLASGKMKTGFCKTKVFVKKLSPKEMVSYIKKVNSYDKAGAYAIQMKPKIVTKIQGSYSNVVGLPEELLKNMLGRF